MGEINGGAPGPKDEVRGVHLLRSVAQRINDAGVAMILCDVDVGGGKQERFALTLDVGGLPALRAVLTDLIDAADKAKLPPGMICPRPAREVSVGHSNAYRGCTVLTLNGGAPDEANYLLPNALALQVAVGMSRDAGGRMTPEEKRRALAAVGANADAGGLLLPKTKLILPGH